MEIESRTKCIKEPTHQNRDTKKRTLDINVTTCSINQEMGRKLWLVVLISCGVQMSLVKCCQLRALQAPLSGSQDRGPRTLSRARSSTLLSNHWYWNIPIRKVDTGLYRALRSYKWHGSDKILSSLNTLPIITIPLRETSLPRLLNPYCSIVSSRPILSVRGSLP